MGSPRSHLGEVKCSVPGHGAGSLRVRVTASGQEKLYSLPCWLSTFSRSAAEPLEGGGSGARAPHSPLGSEQRANKNQ